MHRKVSIVLSALCVIFIISTGLLMAADDSSQAPSSTVPTGSITVESPSIEPLFQAYTSAQGSAKIIAQNILRQIHSENTPEKSLYIFTDEDARAFAVDFFNLYNGDHHHSGIGLMCPGDVHYGRSQEITDRRQNLCGLIRLRE